MDVMAVRTFVAVVDAGQFQEAAVDLSVTPQAVSKRIAALEKELGVRLLRRDARGARLTIDGQAFLPHARAFLQAAERAITSVRPGHRALRVDVIGRRLSLAGLLRDFHRAHPEIELDVVTLFDSDTAVAAVRDGTIDATFRALTMPGLQLPRVVETTPVFDEPLHLFTGPGHEFANARAVTPAQLAGRRIWMPGNLPGTEWSAYYDEFAATYGIVVDSVGPDFGIEPLLDTIAGSTTLATFVSEQTPLVWPVGHDLRRIPVTDPTPLYPHSLVWHVDNHHPSLAALRRHLTTAYPGRPDGGVWVPEWSRSERSAPLVNRQTEGDGRAERDRSAGGPRLTTSGRAVSAASPAPERTRA
ncbi:MULTISPECIES: LysR family transcriptional regulator [Streptomyces]|uniref:LysR family transcriptional regulator n=1 Tax=Streptomyces TaxID=1883 RepID=UPI000CD51144|nr:MULTISPECIES: LysR family transcriptional regulator [Streptomyces]